jgi:spore coat protein U-like protein
MKNSFVQLCAALLLLLPGVAQAAITCNSITSPGLTISYASGTTASTQTYFTITCTRELAGDDTSVNYDATVNAGSTPAGSSNRASQAVAGTPYYVFYDLYRDSCSTQWKGGQKISGTITWASAAVVGPLSQQKTYWGCIPTIQTGMPAGTYSDSLALTATYGQGNTGGTVTGTAAVTIYAPAYCTMSMSAGDMNFTYVAFGPQQTATKTFMATCTNTMPYTLAVNPSAAVVVGLNYSLALNAGNATGTGIAQTFTITGTMPAGQAGNCLTGTCTGTQTHTVTVTY